MNTPASSTQVPVYRGAGEPMKEHNSDSAWNAWRAAANVQVKGRTDDLHCIWVYQLSDSQTAFTSCDFSVCISAETKLKLRKQSRAFEIIVERRLQLESNPAGRIDESEIDHNADRTAADCHIDPIAAISRRLPGQLCHASKTVRKVINHFKRRLFIHRKYQKMLRPWLQSFYCGNGLLKRRRKRDQSALSDCGVLAWW